MLFTIDQTPSSFLPDSGHGGLCREAAPVPAVHLWPSEEQAAQQVDSAIHCAQKQTPAVARYLASRKTSLDAA
jgi:hypothetical protein